MKRTTLYDAHRASGAKMISFGGWEMPRDYGTGTVSEVKACRAGIGLFDVSHMGEFRIQGSEALSFVQYLTSNDASRLTPGKAQYSLFLNEEGGVIDDVLVYRLADEDFLIVVNAGCKDKDWDWCSLQARAYSVSLTDESEETALIAVQGPNAVSAVSTLAGVEAHPIRRFHFVQAKLADVSCTISRTGYTGEDGFEIFCAAGDAPQVWNALLASGGEPCGLAARDVLRIEAAYPLYGHELSEDESPLEVGLQWAIKTSKPDFLGRDATVAKAQEGLRVKLVGLKMSEPGVIPREGYLVLSDLIDDLVGRVTSGTLSPMTGVGIALARIGSGFAEPGTKLMIDIRGRRAACEVTELPFYRGLNH